MLKVFNPSPVPVGNIECLQSAQNWQRKSLSLQGLNLLAVRTHQAHHG